MIKKTRSNFQLGIGKSISEKILSKNENNKIVAIARSEEPLAQLVKTFGENRVLIIVGDISDSKICKKIFNLTMKKFGQINSIILNAGILNEINLISKACLKKWKIMFDVNFFSAVDLVLNCIDELKKNNGKIVSVSSGASVKHYNAWYAYGCSKACLNKFIYALSQDEKDIQTISVAPGVVDTSMQDKIRNDFSMNMSPSTFKKFYDLKKNNNLLSPDIPGEILANLALKGWPDYMNGNYYRIDDDEIQTIHFKEENN